MTHLGRFTPQVLRALQISTMLLAATGCSIAPTESFTFQAELPEHFFVDGTAYYVAAPGEVCRAPSGEERRGPGRRYFPRTAQVDFKVPLTDTEHGCSMVLKRLELGIKGQWGKRDLDMSLQSAALLIDDESIATTPPLPTSQPLVFQRQCQWLFRTVGSKRVIRKILKCRAQDANGTVQKSLVGKTLPRHQLAGRTVKLVLTVAKEEQPYFDRYWIKTNHGWKPCKGNWGRDIEELCVTPPQFKPFKMPDGRDCTVYPNCTE
ncbi:MULTISPECIES: hypothetical protein [Pseudomonas]|uniref:hypothetical protein n=1 Tax=Pseudomonas TaxID=286 RepID=UPI00226563D5|nr:MULTISPECIES: hypothetical protein [Pseudomonas]MDC7816774.1 hypothetical protein [Pseudomonas sp. BLCC-B112]